MAVEQQEIGPQFQGLSLPEFKTRGAESVGAENFLLILSACVLSHFSWVRPCMDVWTEARQASLSVGFSKARILEWVAMPSSRGPSQPRNRTRVSYIYLHWQVGSLPLRPPGKPQSKGQRYPVPVSFPSTLYHRGLPY